MRSTDEQLQEIMQRAEIIRQKRITCKHLARDLYSIAACIVLIIVVSLHIPDMTNLVQNSAPSQYGSLLLAAPYTGYILIGILGFALGICITFLMIHLKKMHNDKKD